MPTPVKGSLDPEVKSMLDALQAGIAGAAPKSQVTQLQRQFDALELKIAERHFSDFGPRSTLLTTLRENESISRLLKDRRGTAVLHLRGEEFVELTSRKSIISGTTTGASRNGVAETLAQVSVPSA